MKIDEHCVYWCLSGFATESAEVSFFPFIFLWEDVMMAARRLWGFWKDSAGRSMEIDP